eukprot:tig00021127_g18695.t1
MSAPEEFVLVSKTGTTELIEPPLLAPIRPEQASDVDRPLLPPQRTAPADAPAAAHDSATASTGSRGTSPTPAWPAPSHEPSTSTRAHTLPPASTAAPRDAPLDPAVAPLLQPTASASIAGTAPLAAPTTAPLAAPLALPTPAKAPSPTDERSSTSLVSGVDNVMGHIDNLLASTSAPASAASRAAPAAMQTPHRALPGSARQAPPPPVAPPAPPSPDEAMLLASRVDALDATIDTLRSELQRARQELRLEKEQNAQLREQLRTGGGGGVPLPALVDPPGAERRLATENEALRQEVGDLRNEIEERKRLEKLAWEKCAETIGKMDALELDNKQLKPLKEQMRLLQEEAAKEKAALQRQVGDLQQQIASLTALLGERDSTDGPTSAPAAAHLPARRQHAEPAAAPRHIVKEEQTMFEFLSPRRGGAAAEGGSPASPSLFSMARDLVGKGTSALGSALTAIRNDSIFSEPAGAPGAPQPGSLPSAASAPPRRMPHSQSDVGQRGRGGGDAPAGMGASSSPYWDAAEGNRDLAGRVGGPAPAAPPPGREQLPANALNQILQGPRSPPARPRARRAHPAHAKSLPEARLPAAFPARPPGAKPAASLPADRAKAVARLVASVRPEHFRSLSRDELGTARRFLLALHAGAGQAQQQQQAVGGGVRHTDFRVCESPDGADVHSYLHVSGAGKAGAATATLVLPPGQGLTASGRAMRRALKAAEGVWPEAMAAAAGKAKEGWWDLGVERRELCLDRFLEASRYAFSVHAGEAERTLPCTLLVYAVGLSASAFDREVAMYDPEKRDRWAVRTPSRKPLALLLFDKDRYPIAASAASAASASTAPGGWTGLDPGLRDAARRQLLAWRGFHYALRPFRPASEFDSSDPRTAALWPRGANLYRDLMKRRELRREERAPFPSLGPADALRQLGFTDEGRQLGRGGFSHVLAYSYKGRPFAVKLQRPKNLPPDVMGQAARPDADVEPMHLEEVRINRLLNTLDWLKKATPNFIPLRDWFFCPRDCSQVQIIDRVDMNLTQFLECFNEKQPEGFITALRGVLIQICVALHHAAGFGFHHNDLKAHNVLLQFHPEPRRLFGEQIETSVPTQPFTQRYLRYVFEADPLAESAQKVEHLCFVLDMHTVPLVKIADFGRSQALALEADPGAAMRHFQAVVAEGNCKIYEASDLRFFLFDLLWRTDRLRTKSIQQLLNNRDAARLLSSLVGRDVNDVRRFAQRVQHAEDASVREVFGRDPERTPLQALRSSSFAAERRAAVEGVTHTWENTLTFVCCPEDVVDEGLSGAHRIYKP